MSTPNPVPVANDNVNVQQTTGGEYTPSPTHTVVDYDAAIDAIPKTRTQSTTSVVRSEKANVAQTPINDNGANINADTDSAPVLTQRKKWSLLLVFSLGFWIDIWQYSAFFVFTGPISLDLEVPYEQSTWVITSYAVTFAAFLLFWGRVSDLYSAKPVFSYGFIALGVLSLVISFLPDRYSFFVLRAISGIAGATLIPASFRLIVAIFEPHELGKAFTIYSSVGAIANSTGVIIAGLIEYIPRGGQGAPWRWFFRIIAILIIPVAVGSLFWIPKPRGNDANVDHKLKRLDLIGAFLMLAAIVLLVLGLTLGASYGWKKAGFLAPFLLSMALFPSFFYWESRLPEGYALLPSKTWRIKNFTVLIILSLFVYSWWSLNFVPLIEIFVRVHDELSIIAAVRVLPQSLAAMVITALLTVYPKFVSRPRWPITFGLIASIVGYVLFSQSGTQVGTDYWRYLFPGQIVGSAGMMVVFTGVNVGIMTTVPSEMAGVAGAMLQVALQVGSAVALSIQAGLMTTNSGGLENFANPRTSFYFVIGWGIVWLVGFLVWYRQPKADPNDVEKVIVAH